MTIGEEVSWLVSERYGTKNGRALTNVLANKVTINLKMFGAFVEHIIVGNVSCTGAVIVKNGGLQIVNVHFKQKSTKANDFSSSDGKSTIFDFSRGAGDNRLLPAYNYWNP